MLSKENVELGSTCNTIGQNLGYFISFVGFLAFNNPEVCNSYFRPLLGKDADAEVGMVSLGDFFTFFGIAMAVTTCLVALFKKERATASDEVENMTNAYGSMYTAAKQPMVQKLFLVLLTYRVGACLLPAACCLLPAACCLMYSYIVYTHDSYHPNSPRN